MHDAKHWHDIELQNLGAVVSRLEAELREMRAEAEQQLQAREHLLSHKCLSGKIPDLLHTLDLQTLFPVDDI